MREREVNPIVRMFLNSIHSLYLISLIISSLLIDEPSLSRPFSLLGQIKIEMLRKHESMFAHWRTVCSMIDDMHLLLDFHFLKYYYECNLICRLACLLNLDFIPVYFNLHRVPEHARGITYEKPCLDISDVISMHCRLFISSLSSPVQLSGGEGNRFRLSLLFYSC